MERTKKTWSAQMSSIDTTSPNPLFIARVNGNGQITIRSDVREEHGLEEGDRVAVYVMRKVIK